MPKKSKPAKRLAFYKSPPPKDRARSPHRAAAGSENQPYHPLPAAPFELREDGSIVPTAPYPDPLPAGEGIVNSALRKSEAVSIRQTPANISPSPGGEGRDEGGQSFPQLTFSSDTPFVRLYHGNCLELLDAIAAKYPEGRFDVIFADPPYFQSNGGITCHAGNPNGIQSFSPGLRGTSYPGSTCETFSNPVGNLCKSI